MFLTYERLEKVSRREPPYRGTTDRFPLYSRRENTKNFYVREEDGQRVFDITYGQRWDTKEITKEEYNSLSARPQRNCVTELPENKILMYTSRPNIIGTVRPGNGGDGEFEFNGKSYGQGDMMFLTKLFRGYFSSMSRRGGMVYMVRREGNSGRTWYPIYRGMRVNARTVEPSVPHEIVIQHVDRKKSKALIKNYEHFFKVSEVMLKSLTMSQLLEMAQSMLAEHRGDKTESRYIDMYKSSMDTAPLDAFVWYCMAHNIGRLHYLAAFTQSVFAARVLDHNAYEELFMSVKRKITKEIYREHPDIFKEVRFACGEEFPSCDWGVKVIVNGQEMEQYK